MKKLFTILITTIFVLVALPSCDKPDTPEPAAESKFTWLYDGTTYVAKQHKAMLNSIGGPSIRAGLQEGIQAGSGPRINLTSLNQGTYTIASGNVTYFDYIDVLGNPHQGNTGSITITKNANNLLSGNFSVTLSNNKTITGDFTNTSIKP